MVRQHAAFAMLIDRLRRSGRLGKILKLTIVPMIVVAWVTTMMAAAGGGGKILEAESLVFKDSSGKVRGKIEASAEQGIVQTLLDSKGNERVKISVDAAGVARIRLIDDAKFIRVGAATFPSDDPRMASAASLVVNGPSGDNTTNGGVQFVSSNDGTIVQSFIDKDKNARIILSARADKSAHVGVYSKDGGSQCAAQMGTIGDGSAHLALFNSSGKASVNAQTTADGDSTQGFFDLNGKERMSFNLRRDGSANQRACDHDGKLRHLVATDGSGHLTDQTYDNDERPLQSKADVVVREVMKPAAPTPTYVPNPSPRFEFPQPKVEEKPREEQCLNCQGGGQVVCGDCKGTGKIACTKCDPAGRVKCTKCDSDGMVTSGFFTKTKSLCPDCSGTKKAKCPDCSGTKRAKCTGWIFGCGGDGKVSCSKCSGLGRIKLTNGR